VILSRGHQRLDELAQRLGVEHGTEVEAVAGDLATPEGRDLVNGGCRDRELDLLVNNAGVAHHRQFRDLGAAELRELLDVNVLARTTQAHTAAPGMVARGKGAIVNFASMLGFSDFHSRQAIDMTNVPRMDANDVVQASLGALERDEVVCIPGLEDPSVLTKRDTAQSELLQVAGRPDLAERYRDAGRADGPR